MALVVEVRQLGDVDVHVETRLTEGRGDGRKRVGTERVAECHGMLSADEPAHVGQRRRHLSAG